MAILRHDPAMTHHRRDCRDLRTEDLLQEYELLQWERLRMVEDRASADSIAIAEAALKAMADEIAHRQRRLGQAGDDPHAPRWPDMSSRRYQQLRQTARDLKVVWPIERFATIAMAVELRRVGRSLVGRCPLPDHEDRTPSFHVYPGDDRWHCFGCNRGGDIFDLTGLYFGLARFRDQVQRIADATPVLLDGAA